jgi:hypothetical protein
MPESGRSFDLEVEATGDAWLKGLDIENNLLWFMSCWHWIDGLPFVETFRVSTGVRTLIKHLGVVVRARVVRRTVQLPMILLRILVLIDTNVDQICLSDS